MKSRLFRSIVLSLVAGLLLGFLGFIILIAGLIWDDRQQVPIDWERTYWQALWGKLTDSDALLASLIFVLPAMASAGLGGVLGCRSSSRSTQIILGFVLLPYLWPMCLSFLDNDRKTIGLVTLILFFITLYMYVAGRVGQSIGRWMATYEGLATRTDHEPHDHAHP